MKNSVVIVTGGSKGYGSGIAEALVKAGAEVWITGRDIAALEAAAAKLGVRHAHADVTDPVDWDRLFKQVLDKTYTSDDYVKQFTIRIPENIAKMERVEKLYRDQGSEVPHLLYDILNQQRLRLQNLQKEQGDYVSPFNL